MWINGNISVQLMVKGFQEKRKVKVEFSPNENKSWNIQIVLKVNKKNYTILH